MADLHLTVGERKTHHDEPVAVSVVVAAYNHAKYIAKTLDTILMQKVGFRIEILVNEDASTDNTAQILKEYEAKYPGVFNVVYQPENIYSKGIKPWFHILFPIAKGRYIALCEGDDYWTDENKLQKQVDFLDANPDFVGCFHNVMIVNETKPDASPKPWREYRKDVFDLRDTFSIYSLLHGNSLLFRREAFHDFALPKKIHSGDMLLFSIIAAKGKLKLIDGFMSVYRKNEGGITSAIRIMDFHRSRIELFTFLDAHYNQEYRADIQPVIAHHKAELYRLENPFLSKVKGKLSSLLKPRKP